MVNGEDPYRKISELKKVIEEFKTVVGITIKHLGILTRRRKIKSKKA